MDIEDLLHHRTSKFRKIGGFQEGLPVDPKRKVNMKRKEEPHQSKLSSLELEGEVEKLKQQILKSMPLSTETPSVDEMIEKLKQEVDNEFSEAVQALGLKDRLLKLREELSKARNSQDELTHPVLLDKVERFKAEFSQRLSTAPNSASLNYKLNMLKELSNAKKISETKSKSTTLKQEVNKKFKEILDRPDIKEKVEMLKSELEKSKASTLDDMDNGLKKKITEVKKEIQTEFATVLRSLDLDLKIVETNAGDTVEGSLPTNVKSMIGELDEEIHKKIEETVNSSDLRNKINLLKLELAKAGKNADGELRNRIQVISKEIKETLAEALSTSELVEKHGKVSAEIEKVLESDGSSSKSTNSGSKAEISIGAERSYA